MKMIAIFALSACSFIFGFSGGDGSPGNPYQISTKADLDDVNNDLTAHYVLINDIDLTGHTYTTAVIGSGSTNASWMYFASTFEGSFDGANHAIIRLTINGVAGVYRYGLVGRIKTGAVIKNVRLVDCSIAGGGYVGSLLGESEGGLITNCSSQGTVVGLGNMIGGLVGRNKYANISHSSYIGNVSGLSIVGGLLGDCYDSDIYECYSGGYVEGESRIAGLIGFASLGTVSKCHSASDTFGTSNHVAGLVSDASNCYVSESYATGNVTGEANYVGGLIGELDSNDTSLEYTVSSCYASGTVLGGGYSVGGLIGEMGRGNITKCYATGNVSGNTYVGGLVSYTEGNISQCYSVGHVGSNGSAGGLLVNKADLSEIMACFWNVETSGQNSSAGGEEKTTSQMKQSGTYTAQGWSFFTAETGSGEWFMSKHGYPKLFAISYGDVSGNGVVDQEDLAILANQWLEMGDKSSDLNGDGIVDIIDFLAMACSWLNG